MVESLTELNYRRVIGRLMAQVQDSTADDDDIPDGRPLQGKLLFTASINRLRPVDPAASQFSFTLLKPIPAMLDDQGYICSIVIDAFGAEGLGPRGVNLTVTDDPGMSPSGTWTWHVEFSDMSIQDLDQPGDDDAYMDGFDFSLPMGDLSDIDIHVLEPVSSGPGTLTIQGPAGQPLNLVDTVASSAALPSNLTIADAGKAYQTSDTGNVYVWSGTGYRGPFLFRGPSGGPKGDAGPAPVFTTVVTELDPGQTPTASVTGTSPNLTLNLGIPGVPDNLALIDDEGDPSSSTVNSSLRLEQIISDLHSSLLSELQVMVEQIALPAGTVIRIVQNTDGSYPTVTAAQAPFAKAYIGDVFPTTGVNRGDTYEYAEVNL